MADKRISELDPITTPVSTDEFPVVNGGTTKRVTLANAVAAVLVNLVTGVTGRLPFANLAQGSALSVLGITGNATADHASIVAAADNQVLRRSGTAVAFGAVADASLSSNVPLKNGTNAFTGANSFATNPLDLLVGQLKFPATQNASSDANTLDDVEKGTWTPVLTFATPGNLSVVYSVQYGAYTKIGNLVMLHFNIATSTFTHTTASGNAQITGLPFTSLDTAGQSHYIGSPMHFGGITKASYTQFAPLLPENSATLLLSATGSGVAAAAVQAADMPTGGTVEIDSVVLYRV